MRTRARALIIVFISVLKRAPFLSILVGTFAAGFSAGLPLEALAGAFSKGVSALHADLGLTLGLGLIVAIPAVILAGPLYGMWLSGRMQVAEPEELGELFTAHQNTAEPPGFAISLITILQTIVSVVGLALTLVLRTALT